MLAGLTPGKECRLILYRILADQYSDTVGVTFVAVVLTAMTIGISAAVYYSWVAPCFARRRLRRHLRSKHQKPQPMESPSLDTEKPGSPTSTTSSDQWGDSPLASLSRKEKETDIEANLPAPAPVYFFPKRFRFSTSTQDGREAVWWFV